MKIWKSTGCLLVLFLLLMVWIFFVGFSASEPGSFYDKGKNAVWLEHEWVDTLKTDAEVRELVTTLQKNGFGTIFVHSGPFGEDGLIEPETYNFAVDFINKMDSFAPEIEVQAWLGQVRGKIDLDKVEVRENIAKQCQIMADLVGFDGIHFDIEPVWDEDLAFIETLQMCREKISDKKKISVALAEFIPKSLVWLSDHVHPLENYNTNVNYKNVAEYADQIVVMAYDTSFKTAKWYRWLVSEQVIWVTKLYKDKEVFVGIPAYEEKTDAFDPAVENVATGAQGILDGLNNMRSRERNFAGVAIYRYAEMSEEEWADFREIWQE